MKIITCLGLLMACGIANARYITLESPAIQSANAVTLQAVPVHNPSVVTIQQMPEVHTVPVPAQQTYYGTAPANLHRFFDDVSIGDYILDVLRDFISSFGKDVSVEVSAVPVPSPTVTSLVPSAVLSPNPSITVVPSPVPSSSVSVMPSGNRVLDPYYQYPPSENLYTVEQGYAVIDIPTYTVETPMYATIIEYP